MGALRNHKQHNLNMFSSNEKCSAVTQDSYNKRIDKPSFVDILLQTLLQLSRGIQMLHNFFSTSVVYIKNLN